MIFSAHQIQVRFQRYANVNAAVEVKIKNKDLFRLKRGLYSDDACENPLAIANALYGPSYLSFSYALSRYDMIPEAVYAYQSATTLKNRSKEFQNEFGRFTYRDVPAAAFPYGVQSEGGILIASREKALCDLLYLLPPQHSLKDLEALLFEDQRLNRDEVLSLSWESLSFLLPRYSSQNAELFLRWGKKHRG